VTKRDATQIDAPITKTEEFGAPPATPDSETRAKPTEPRAAVDTNESTNPASRTGTGRVCPKCSRRFQPPARLCAIDGEALEPLLPQPGAVVAGRYRLERILGQGGMGVVFVATHMGLGRPVALKFLRGEVADDPQVLRRFQREARAASAIRHAAIVDVLDFGEDPEFGVYYAMELVPGHSLAAHIRDAGALPSDEVVRIGAALADALSAAHEHGIVHRDLKPENVILADARVHGADVKVLDFGIAGVRQLDSEERLTATGSVFGTPQYMSPEQAVGREVSLQSDIYSLGVILYEMATGTLPFSAPTPLAFLQKHVSEPPRPPRDLVSTVPGWLEAVILRCLAKDPGLRFSSMGELRDALRESYPQALVFDPEPRAAPRIGELVPPEVTRTGLKRAIVAAAILVGVGGGAATWFATRTSGPEPSGAGGFSAALSAPLTGLSQASAATQPAGSEAPAAVNTGSVAPAQLRAPGAGSSVLGSAPPALPVVGSAAAVSRPRAAEKQPRGSAAAPQVGAEEATPSRPPIVTVTPLPAAESPKPAGPPKLELIDVDDAP
jgi:hypothetical protein